MTVDGTETLFLTLAFLIPGFIWNCIHSVFNPRQTERIQLLFLRFLTFSCINYGLWSWLLYLVLASEFFEKSAIFTGIAWLIMILVSPLVLGFTTGLLSQKELFRRVFARMGLSSIHGIPTAWDYKFSKTRKSVWIQVTLKDDKKIRGLYGRQSFASSVAEERDLYLQQVLRVSKDGKWERLKRSDGVLIKGNEIKYIEFIRVE